MTLGPGYYRFKVPLFVTYRIQPGFDPRRWKDICDGSEKTQTTQTEQKHLHLLRIEAKRQLVPNNLAL